MTARHESVTCLPDKRPLGGDDAGFSPPVPSSSSGQAGGSDSRCCFFTTPSSATTMLFHNCSSAPSSSQKQACTSSFSSPQNVTPPSCSVRSSIQHSRPAEFDSPSSGASPLWPASEHPGNRCSRLAMGLSSIDAAILALDHAWDARVTERLYPWAGLAGVGVVLFSPGSFLASDRRYSSIEVLMKPTALFFRQICSDSGLCFVLAPTTG